MLSEKLREQQKNAQEKFLYKSEHRQVLSRSHVGESAYYEK